MTAAEHQQHTAIATHPDTVAALATVAGQWAIVRQTKHRRGTRAWGFRSERDARQAWSRTFLRDGWALLVGDDGRERDRQVAP